MSNSHLVSYRPSVKKDQVVSEEHEKLGIIC